MVAEKTLRKKNNFSPLDLWGGLPHNQWERIIEAVVEGLNEYLLYRKAVGRERKKKKKKRRKIKWNGKEYRSCLECGDCGEN